MKRIVWLVISVIGTLLGVVCWGILYESWIAGAIALLFALAWVGGFYYFEKWRRSRL